MCCCVCCCVLSCVVVVCCCVLLCVEWFFYSKRIIIDKRADLTDFFVDFFVGKMRVFVSRPMKIVTFLRKNADTPKRVVDFPLKRDTFRNKIMEIVEDLDEKSYNNNGKPLEIVEDFACESIFLFFSFFHFSHFFFF